MIWKRTSAHSAAVRWGDIHDTILFYTRSERFTWNEVLLPHTEEYAARYKNQDPDGRMWADDNLTGPGIRHGDSGAAWRGFNPTARGVHWKINLKAVEAILGAEGARKLSTTAKLDLLDQHGYIHWPRHRGEGSGFPRFQAIPKRRRQTPRHRERHSPGQFPGRAERLGYPTQKPEALLERIIRASSNEGDTVLDPFCGCGTAVAVAQRLKRSWVGIDITHLAIGLVRRRLIDAFGEAAGFHVIGEPVSLPDAEKLAREEPYQFQAWALGLIGARQAELKKGADKGIDGPPLFP